MNVVEISNLKKYYGKSRGVENASFTLKEGEILGFVGPNGAGKSTVIRVLMGLIKKTSGEVRIFGDDTLSHKNNSIGYLPSEVFLYPELTVRKQLEYFASVRNISLEKMEYLLDTLDLDANKKISDLSFGNRKKVGIIAALMHEPRLIILDEPTSGLDPLIQQRFLDLLVEAKANGSSIILSSHVLNEVEKVCDRVALIRDGVVLFNRDLKELKLSNYRKVYVSPKESKFDIKDLSFIASEENEAIYAYNGDINNLIKSLTNFKLDSLRISELSLEEIFMHYYQKGDNHD